MPEVDSDNKEYLLSADLDDLVWSKEPLPDIQEYLCIHKIPGQASPPLQPDWVDMPASPSHNPIKLRCQWPHPHNLVK